MRFKTLKHHHTRRNILEQLLADLISSCGCPPFKAFSFEPKLHTYPANLCKSDQICWNGPEEHAKDVSLCISMDFNNARALEVTMMPFHSIYKVLTLLVKPPSTQSLWNIQQNQQFDDWVSYLHPTSGTSTSINRWRKNVIIGTLRSGSLKNVSYPTPSLLSFWAKMVGLKPWHCCKGRLTLDQLPGGESVTRDKVESWRLPGTTLRLEKTACELCL